MKIYGEQVDDYEKTIMKFRRRIAELNAEIQEQHDDVNFTEILDTTWNQIFYNRWLGWPLFVPLA